MATTFATAAEPLRHPRGEPRDEGADSGASISAKQVLHSLRRTWFVGLPLAIAIAVVVYVTASSQIEPSYTARTLIHVGTHRPVLLYDEGTGGGDTGNHQRTQMAAAKCKVVRETVVRDLAPKHLKTLQSKADPVAWLEKELVTDYKIAPEIMSITMKGSVPDDLIAILNSARDAYLNEIARRDRVDRAARLTQLKELGAKHDGAVTALKQKFTTRADALGVRDLNSARIRNEHLLTRINSMQNELLLARLEAQREDVAPPNETGPKSEPPLPDSASIDAALSPAFASDAVAEGHRKEIVRLEKKAADFERRLRNFRDDPEYKQAVADVLTAKAALNQRRETLRVEVIAALRAAPRPRIEKPSIVPVNEKPLTVVRQQIALLETEIQRKTQEVTELVNGISDLETIRTEASTQEDQLKLVNTKIRAIEVELEAPSRAGVIEDAAIVETPRWDRPLKFAGAPAALAFLSVLGLVGWLDLRRGRVNGSDDVEAAGIRVIGALPAVRPNVLPAFDAPALPSASREYHQLADAIDMTRTVIAPVLASAAPGYTIAVTSAGPGEGKTVTSAHLAARFARAGTRTLIVDTDVRRPKLHTMFGVDRGAGFGEWVGGKAALDDVAIRTSVPGLDVVTAGGSDPRAVYELLEQRFPELLRDAKDVYDVIVLDTAPLLKTPETLALSRMADGVVLSAMRDVSRAPGLQACVHRLAAVEAHVLGAVVTGDASSGRHGYY